MKIKKYVARSMPEALQQVHDDLGADAVILNTRQIRRNSRFNPHGEARVEVTAAMDEVAGPRAVSPAAPRQAAPLAARRYAPTALPGPALPAGPPATPVPAPPAQDWEQVLRQLRQLQESVARLERRTAPALVLPESLGRLAERLRSKGMGEELVVRLTQELFQELDGGALSDPGQVASRAAARLAQMLPGRRDIRIGRRRKVIGFVGAGGAGKTTALAKVAAGFAGKYPGVVVISADDRRPGALDQARAFAEIIGTPLEAAGSEAQIRAALERHPTARLVLIDMAGCGPHEHRQWEQQRRLLEAAGVQEVQVVLDGMTSLEHMLDVIEAARVFPERRLLFAKMDQVVRPGVVLSAAVHSQVSPSYLTMGPDLSGGIEAGDLARLAGRMIGTEAERAVSR